MSLRAIYEFFVHLESFRNIQMWYQGIYSVQIQIQQKQNLEILAHPFAHTENYQQNQYKGRSYSEQICKLGMIDEKTSSFFSKTFKLTWFDEEVKLNDMCHFRIESPLNSIKYYLINVTLFFNDTTKCQLQGKQKFLKHFPAKTISYQFRVNSTGVHEYKDVVFEKPYCSLLKMIVHTVCIDFRFRISHLQLSDFIRLNYNQKDFLIKSNNKLVEKPQFIQVCEQLNFEKNQNAISLLQKIIVGEMKKIYAELRKEYLELLPKIITQKYKKQFPNYSNKIPSLCQFEQKIQNIKLMNLEKQFQEVMNEGNLIAVQVIQLWGKFIEMVKIRPDLISAYYRKKYCKKQKKFWSELVSINRIDKDILYDENTHLQDQGTSNYYIDNLLFSKKRNINTQLYINEPYILNSQDQLPHLIINQYLLKPIIPLLSSVQTTEGVHLVIFVHGFQGSSYDMHIIKNYFTILYPHLLLLSSSSNQNLTNSGIQEMGNRLAQQIIDYIVYNFLDDIQKLSFVCTSLGGLIARACLPKLQNYRQFFHAFATFSSPHLGYNVNTSSIVKIGIWVLEKLKESQSLKQLSLSDHKDPFQTYLFKLSQTKGLQYFKHILLFGSRQDSYAPYESARIQINSTFKPSQNILQN